MGNPIDDLRQQARTSNPFHRGFNWRQAIDLIVPGNIYNNDSREWRPQGMAAGALQSVTGMPATISDRLFGAFRSGQNNGLGDRTSLGPVRPSGTAQAPVDAFGNTLGQTRTPVAQGERTDAFGNVVGGGATGDYRMPGTGGERPQRNTSTQLGAGQRFGSQMSFADHYDAMMSRGGTQAER